MNKAGVFTTTKNLAKIKTKHSISLRNTQSGNKLNVEKRDKLLAINCNGLSFSNSVVSAICIGIVVSRLPNQSGGQQEKLVCK